MIESTETPKRTEALLDAYKAKDEVETVLDPKAIDKSTLDKLPTPTGYRILVLPFAGPKKTKGGLWLSDTTQETIQMTTVCGLVLKIIVNEYGFQLLKQGKSKISLKRK